MDGTLAQALLALAAILAAARLVGALAARLGQPRIGGEMVAGLLVGGALLSPWRRGAHGAHVAVLGANAVRFVDLLGHVGVVLYLLLVGLTLCPADVRRNARRIGAVAVPAIVVAAALAPLAAAVFSARRWGLAGGADGLLTMAGALLVSGFPVVARILEERGILRGDFGATVLGTSALLAVVPFLLLGVAERRSHQVLAALGLVVVLVLGAGAAVLWPAVAGRLRLPPARDATRMTVAVIASLAVAWMTLKLLGTALLGGFVVGVALSRSTATRAAVEGALGRVVPAVLIPVFLAAAGARLHPSELDGSVAAGVAIFTVMLGVVAGVAGMVGARVASLGDETRAAVALLNCRGLMLLALGGEMADHHLIGSRLVAVFFVGAPITTLMTGPLLGDERLRRRGARGSHPTLLAGRGRARLRWRGRGRPRSGAA